MPWSQTSPMDQRLLFIADRAREQDPMDGFSRCLLYVQAFLSPSHKLTQPVFERLFREYGLSRIIRTHNGAPFATTAIGRLSRLSVWWIRLGIFPELIEPAYPEQNARHERMHRTLKAETATPPLQEHHAQRTRFDGFRHFFNHECPHEVRRVSRNGGVR